MKIINKNILDVNIGIIGHQANCRGSMGSGLAKQIKNKYPSVYKEYVQCKQTHGLLLGMTTYTQVHQNLWVANLMGQDHWKGTAPLTNYTALSACLKTVNVRSEILGIPLYLPYKLGCGLAGGDWNIVSDMIDEIAPNAIICKL